MNEPTLHYLVSSVDGLQSAVRKSLELSAPDHLQTVVCQEISGLSQQ